MSASFGDNLARRDVTASLQSKAEGGSLEVTANEELIPAFEVSEETKLSQNEINQITKQAQEQCSGGSDTDCVRATKAKLMQQKHEEKANTDNSAANIIAGRSLTVKYVDEKGAVKRVVVPDGQSLKLDDVEFKESFTTKKGMSKLEGYKSAILSAGGWVVWIAVLVFSVAASFRVFRLSGNLLLAVGVTTLALVLPLLVGAPPFIGVILIVGISAFFEMGRQSAGMAAALPVASLLGQ